MPLLTVQDLRTSFHTRNGVYRAVDGVSFDLARGETLGIVGESGSGKSVTCYSLMGLVPQPPGRIESGTAVFDGIDLLHCPPRTARSIRGKRIAMIFQDPMTSLNPYLRVSDQLIEPLRIHEQVSKTEALRRGIAMLEMGKLVGARRGDMRQRHRFHAGPTGKARKPGLDRQIQLDPVRVDQQCDLPCAYRAEQNRTAVLPTLVDQLSRCRTQVRIAGIEP